MGLPVTYARLPRERVNVALAAAVAVVFAVLSALTAARARCAHARAERQLLEADGLLGQVEADGVGTEEGHAEDEECAVVGEDVEFHKERQADAIRRAAQVRLVLTAVLVLQQGHVPLRKPSFPRGALRHALRGLLLVGPTEPEGAPRAVLEKGRPTLGLVQLHLAHVQLRGDDEFVVTDRHLQVRKRVNVGAILLDGVDGAQDLLVDLRRQGEERGARIHNHVHAIRAHRDVGFAHLEPGELEPPVARVLGAGQRRVLILELRDPPSEIEPARVVVVLPKADAKHLLRHRGQKRKVVVVWPRKLREPEPHDGIIDCQVVVLEPVVGHLQQGLVIHLHARHRHGVVVDLSRDIALPVMNDLSGPPVEEGGRARCIEERVACAPAATFRGRHDKLKRSRIGNRHHLLPWVSHLDGDHILHVVAVLHLHAHLALAAVLPRRNGQPRVDVQQ